MRILLHALYSVLILAIFSCNQSKEKASAEREITVPGASPDTAPVFPTTLPGGKVDHSGDDLNFLRDYAEKYPADIRLLENEAFTRRLKAITGNRYQFLKETWSVETPMELKGDIFIAKACMAHNCDATNFIIIVDLEKNKMYAGIREEGKVKLYGEDDQHPDALKQWKNKND